ncbi:MAG: lycopene cyclase domain-containing protein [Crocinitomicaceae bacterium]|nr:lycopene cyclase domain-containing protein [Crocinitomicaceae bacterium]
MKALYLWLDLATIFFPLVLSFDKKVAYFRQWKFVFAAGLIVGIPFLVWDYYFTHARVWGFNPNYLTGIYITNLPIEEVLFFVVVPFSCVFIYACVKAYFEKIKFRKLNKIFYVFILSYLFFILIFGYHGAYSQFVIATSLLTLLVIWRLRNQLHFLPISFLISIIPFMLVNSVLTGGLTTEPIVWYDDQERTPFRIFTIPAEDILYSFTLLGLNISIFELTKKIFKK